MPYGIWHKTYFSLYVVYGMQKIEGSYLYVALFMLKILQVLTSYVTQRKLMRLFEGDIKTDIKNSTYCSIPKEHFDIKIIFISYSYQKL